MKKGEQPRNVKLILAILILIGCGITSIGKLLNSSFTMWIGTLEILFSVIYLRIYNTNVEEKTFMLSVARRENPDVFTKLGINTKLSRFMLFFGAIVFALLLFSFSGLFALGSYHGPMGLFFMNLSIILSVVFILYTFFLWFRRL